MRVCIVGAGDGGAMAANQIRRLDSEAQIDVFSKRKTLGCPPCPMLLVLSGNISTWDELIHGFRQNSFWEKRNINLHLGTEVTGISPDGKYIVTGGEKYGYDKLILALGAKPSIPSFPGLDGKNEFVLSTDMAHRTGGSGGSKSKGLQPGLPVSQAGSLTSLSGRGYG